MIEYTNRILQAIQILCSARFTCELNLVNIFCIRVSFCLRVSVREIVYMCVCIKTDTFY